MFPKVKKLKSKNRTYIRLLQTVFFLLAYGFLWNSLTDVSSGDWQKFGNSLSENPIVLSLVLLLMPVNWLLESKKWQFLNRTFQEMSLADSIRGVLAGTYLSLFSPNRIGDMAGRVYLSPPESRKQAATASFYGSAAQLSITVIFGLIGVFFVSAERGGFEPLIVVGGTGIGIFVLISYFNLEKICRGSFRLFPKKWNLTKHFHLEFKTRTAFKTLLFSATRYAVFTLQFTLLLLAFGIQLPFLQIFCGIGLIYLISAIIPTALLGELGIRESVALFIFGFWTNEPAGVFAATFTLWLINLVIPAVFGGFFFNTANRTLSRVKA